MTHTVVLDSVRVFDPVLEILIGVANRSRSKACKLRTFAGPTPLVKSGSFQAEEVSSLLGGQKFG